MGWTVKGKSFITCDRGDGYLRKLEDFETDPQIHPSFLEMTAHKIQLLWKFPPSDCCGNSPCTDSPTDFFSEERGGGPYTSYSRNHEYSSYKSCSLQNRCYFSRFPGKVNNKKIGRKNDAWSASYKCWRCLPHALPTDFENYLQQNDRLPITY